jgi:Niemann-Pick C1 protein
MLDAARKAVDTLDFHVTKKVADGFFDSCKEVKLGMANALAMDFIAADATVSLIHKYFAPLKIIVIIFISFITHIYIYIY